MDASRAERLIHEILQEYGLNYKMEYIFPDLRSENGKPLRFDFVVFDDDGNIDFLIEYQGKQHYEASSKFGGKRGLYQQQHNDNIFSDNVLQHKTVKVAKIEEVCKCGKAGCECNLEVFVAFDWFNINTNAIVGFSILG